MSKGLRQQELNIIRHEIAGMKRTIDSLQMALRESLTWSLVEEKGKGPYRVPYAMQADLWLFVDTTSKSEAIRFIDKAIDEMIGQQSTGQQFDADLWATAFEGGSDEKD